MSTGNYDHDNFVRVDCALSAEQFYVNAVHEVAHFSLGKQSFFGLLCFLLRQDARDTRSPLEASLRTLEQALECTHECYARTKELLLCTGFAAARPEERENMLAAQRSQPYYRRYHLERLEPILLQYDLAARCPLFPDFFFLMAAEVDVLPLLDCGFDPPGRLQSRILTCPEAFYPDHRLVLLIEAFASLLRRCPPERIDRRLLAREARLSCEPLSPRSIKRFLYRLAVAVPDRPVLQALLAENLRRLEAEPYPVPTPGVLADSFRLSLSDCVIPAALEERFQIRESMGTLSLSESSVLCLFLEPELLFLPQMSPTLTFGPRSAILQLTDIRDGYIFPGTYLPDLKEYRFLLEACPGAVYLYLDDYARYCRLGPFRSAPVFFRADVPWDALGAELACQRFQLRKLFLQRYSECVFFLFGFDPLDNVVFSMLAHWEMDKIRAALWEGAVCSCGLSDADCYGPHPWYLFRNLIAAVTEDRAYGQLDCGDFHRLRLL